MVFTLFDYFIIILVLFFMLLGLVRGFIKEIFSLIGWIGSGFLTSFLSPLLSNLIVQKVPNVMIANLLSSAIVFVLTIILFSILLNQISRKINTRIPISLNITLGTAFGFIKGFFISSLIFIMILNIFGSNQNIESKKTPEWLKNSVSYKSLSFGAFILMPFSDSLTGKLQDSQIINTIISNGEALEEKTEEKKEEIKEKIEEKKDDIINKTTEDIGGYKKEQIKNLERLIEVIE